MNNSHRVDDNAEAIRKRLNTFHSQTEPVADFYEDIGRLREVDASGTVNEVYSVTRKYFIPRVIFEVKVISDVCCQVTLLLAGPYTPAKEIAEKLEARYGYELIDTDGTEIVSFYQYIS